MVSLQLSLPTNSKYVSVEAGGEDEVGRGRRPRRRLQEVSPGEGGSVQGYADAGRDGIEQRPKPLKARVADDPSLSLYMERCMCAA